MCATGSLCGRHPFVDGNKRTTFDAADNQIGIRGTRSMQWMKRSSLLLEVAEYNQTRVSVEAWLKEKTGL
jgi:prophage maintenance system killer protein